MKLSTKRRALVVNGVLAVLLVGGAGVAFASLTGGPAGEVAPPTARVGRGSVIATVSASGAVESARTRSLSFGATGTVKKIYVEAGEKVAKGQVLARLDDTAAREALDAAKASLNVAYDTDTSTAQGYSQYIQARNAYREAGRTLDGTVIKAPFAGTVTAVNGTAGGSSSGTGTSSTGDASSSGGFIDIADTGKLQVVGDFTESDVTKLKTGGPATVTFDALPGVSASGKVTRISPVPQTTDNVVQYAVTISLTGVPKTVRLGQTTGVQVVVAKADGVLTVPTSAVTTAGGQSTVTVFKDGRRVPVRVEIGVRGDGTVEIVSGLSEGDQVLRTATTTDNGRQNGFPGGGFPGGGGIRVGGGAGR